MTGPVKIVHRVKIARHAPKRRRMIAPCAHHVKMRHASAAHAVNVRRSPIRMTRRLVWTLPFCPPPFAWSHCAKRKMSRMTPQK